MKLCTLFNTCVSAALDLHCWAWAFLWLWRAGAALHSSAQAAPCSGVSCCRPRVPAHSGFSSGSVWAQELWPLCLVALRHMGSSWPRDQTHIPCIDRQMLHHWATKEFHVLLLPYFLAKFISSNSRCVDALEFSV